MSLKGFECIVKSSYITNRPREDFGMDYLVLAIFMCVIFFSGNPGNEINIMASIEQVKHTIRRQEVIQYQLLETVIRAIVVIFFSFFHKSLNGMSGYE